VCNRWGETVEVLISRWPGPWTFANTEATRRIAVTFTSPETFESYQIKRHVTDCSRSIQADRDLSATFTKVIRERILRLGEPPRLVEPTFSARGLCRVRVIPEAVYLQKPGKNAG
jgi:hypothetical protein